MGTDDAVAASNPGSPAEGARMISEETVSRFLHIAPPPSCPDDVRARLRATIANEVELRRASRVEPGAGVPDVDKPHSALWTEHTVRDD